MLFEGANEVVTIIGDSSRFIVFLSSKLTDTLGWTPLPFSPRPWDDAPLINHKLKRNEDYPFNILLFTFDQLTYIVAPGIIIPLLTRSDLAWRSFLSITFMGTILHTNKQK